MTEREIVELAGKHCDVTADSRGRLTYSFDGYGLLAFTAALSAQAAQPVAEGWKLVPVVPTKAMIEAAIAANMAFPRRKGSPPTAGDVMAAEYSAYLEAAPASQPVSSPTTGGAAPMTVGQLGDLWLYRKNIHDGDLMPQLYDFARAIEAHHGIPAPQGKEE